MLSIIQRVIDKLTEDFCVSFMTDIADLFKCKISYKGVNGITFYARQIASII
jgi:hypothetical protein